VEVVVDVVCTFEITRVDGEGGLPVVPLTKPAHPLSTRAANIKTEDIAPFWNALLVLETDAAVLFPALITRLCLIDPRQQEKCGPHKQANTVTFLLKLN
jgi:hypothetical protein